MSWWNKPEPDISAEFDIEGIDVIVVCRDSGGNTEIGYKDATGVALSWILTTTDDQHRTFVTRLTAKLAARQNKLLGVENSA
jgi:hypothetical protein